MALTAVAVVIGFGLGAADTRESMRASHAAQLAEQAVSAAMVGSASEPNFSNFGGSSSSAEAASDVAPVTSTAAESAIRRPTGPQQRRASPPVPPRSAPDASTPGEEFFDVPR